MKILYHSVILYPHLFDILKAEGHTLSVWWQPTPVTEAVLDSLLAPNVTIHNGTPFKEWSSDWADLYFSNYNSYQYLYRGDAPKQGSSPRYNPESNRSAGKQFAADCGLVVKPFRKAATFAAARQFLADEPDGKFFIKYYRAIPCANKHHAGLVLDDLEEMKGAKQSSRPIIIERYIDGYEVDFSFWVPAEGVSPLILVNQEYKGVHNQNRGYAHCGEAGTVFQFKHISDIPERIANAIRKATGIFQATGYCGFVGMNTMFDGKDYNFLEWTVRCGIPTESYVAAFTHKLMGYGRFLADMAGKQSESSRDFDSLYGACGAGIGFLPIGLGYYDYKNIKPQPVYTTIPNAGRDPFIAQFCCEPNKTNGLTATGDGIALFVIGAGATVNEAVRDAYARAAKIEIPMHTYRDDIGSQWQEWE
jgi:phosphoribosylamine-glycine ligase